jgi:pyruvate,orthophosphate dikinase
LELKAEGVSLELTLLISLVSCEEEISVLAKLAHDVAADVFLRNGRVIRYQLGALLESPGATICAAEISDHVNVIVFGTNDLTRMTYGFSNNDTYLEYCLEQGVLRKNPFVTLDQRGVGHLMKCAIGQIRQHNPEVDIGVCGDHSADPESAQFFESLGVSFAACALPVLERANCSLSELSSTSVCGHPYEQACNGRLL